MRTVSCQLRRAAGLLAGLAPGAAALTHCCIWGQGAASSITLELLPPQLSGEGTMQLDTSASGGQVVLRGTGGVELASALNWYMNDYLNATYDWSTYAEGQLPAAITSAGDQSGAAMALPLPLPASKRLKTRAVPHSYYLNVCTHGYSLAFAPWEYWSRHIDWMAMNSVTIPLAFVGQVSPLLRPSPFCCLVSFRLAEIKRCGGRSTSGCSCSRATTSVSRTNAASTPVLPWQRMGNMRGFGGPLTEDWIHKRKELNLKMLARMRGLGMTPALPAFGGHVPRNFTKLFPHANFSRSPDWSGFSGSDSATAAYADVSMLETTDPLFVELGSKFIELQTKVYSTDHLYQTDTFNEMPPPTNDTDYLARSSRNTYAAMAAADPSAVWLMQAWLFTDGMFWQPAQIEAYLSGVATEKLWLLDLSGDSRPFWSQTESFAGHPFILCTLLNFGGQQGLNGNINRMRLGVQAALAEDSSVVGVGLTMEGIWQNYPHYEATLQQAWREDTIASKDAAAPADSKLESEEDMSMSADVCGYAPASSGTFLAGYPESLGCDPWLAEKGANPGTFGCAGRWPYNRSDPANAQA